MNSMDSAPSTTFRRRLRGIMIVGLIVRAAMIACADGRPSFDFPDSRRYVKVARHIAEGLGPIDSPEIRSGTDPVYPLLISLPAFRGMDDVASLYRWARIVNLVFGVASICVVAAIGHRLAGESVGLIAAAFYALDPITLFFTALVLTETCFTLLLLVSMWLILQSRSAAPGPIEIIQTIGAGLALGLATMTRSSSLLLIFLLIVLAASGVKRRRITVALAMGCSFLLGLSPTLLRNYHLFGACVPVRTGNGASLMEALGPWADGGPGMNRIQYPQAAPEDNELDKDHRCREAAIRWAKDNPAQTLALSWSKFKRTWSVTMNAAGYSSFRYNLVSVLSVTPIYLLAFLGFVRIRRHPWTLAFLVTPIVYFSLLHCIFVGSVRYRVPVMPFVFVVAATGLCSLIRGSIPSAKSDILTADGSS